MSVKKVIRRPGNGKKRYRTALPAQPEERYSEYWICDDCVKQKHGEWRSAYPFGGNTVTMGLCGHCERRDAAMLTPVRDFLKPEQKSQVWD